MWGTCAPPMPHHVRKRRPWRPLHRKTPKLTPQLLIEQAGGVPTSPVLPRILICVFPKLMWAHVVLCSLTRVFTACTEVPVHAGRATALCPCGLAPRTLGSHRVSSFNIGKGLRSSDPARFSYRETEARGGERTFCLCSMLVSSVHVRLPCPEHQCLVGFLHTCHCHSAPG